MAVRACAASGRPAIRTTFAASAPASLKERGGRRVLPSGRVRMVARANVGLAGEVPDVEPTDELEEYLRTAAVLGEAGPVQGGGAHPDKLRLLLEGGVQVIAKPAVHGNPDSELMMRREAAGWLIAKALGYTGLVGATVLRTIPHDHGDIEASIQVFWPDGNLFCAPIQHFPLEDRSASPGWSLRMAGKSTSSATSTGSVSCGPLSTASTLIHRTVSYGGSRVTSRATTCSRPSRTTLANATSGTGRSCRSKTLRSATGVLNRRKTPRHPPPNRRSGSPPRRPPRCRTDGRDPRAARLGHRRTRDRAQESPRTAARADPGAAARLPG